MSPPGFRAQPLEHGRRAVHAPHVKGSLREWDRNSARTNPELEDPPSDGQSGQKVDRSVSVEHSAIDVVVVDRRAGPRKKRRRGYFRLRAPQRTPITFPGGHEMVSEGRLDQGDGPGPENDGGSLVGLGFQKTANEIVEGDVLVHLVCFDVHVIEPPTFDRHTERFEPRTVAAHRAHRVHLETGEMSDQRSSEPAVQTRTSK